MRRKGLCEHLKEDPSHTLLYFFHDRARDRQKRPLPRHVHTTDWANMETVVLFIKLSVHAKRPLVMGTVPFSNVRLQRVIMTVDASFEVYIAGIFTEKTLSFRRFSSVALR